jgi:prepilin-type N-terminal cleavage/methylation domain-containing protein
VSFDDMTDCAFTPKITLATRDDSIETTQSFNMKTSPYIACRYNHRAGFTLIELLVVIAIIAILAALLLPALAKAKDKAMKTVDLNNNKQIALAANMYTGDNGEYLPNAGWGTAEPSWAYGRNLAPTTGTSAAGFANALAQQLTYFKQGQLYPYIKTERVMLCPADKVNALFYQRGVLFTSYVFNGAINAYAAGSAGRPYKITQFKPLQVLMWETDEKTPFFFNDSSSFPDEGISERHGKGAIIALYSGSTERITVKNWYGNEFAGQTGSRGGAIPANMLPNRAWCNPGHPTGRY